MSLIYSHGLPERDCFSSGDEMGESTNFFGIDSAIGCAFLGRIVGEKFDQVFETRGMCFNEGSVDIAASYQLVSYAVE